MTHVYYTQAMRYTDKLERRKTAKNANKYVIMHVVNDVHKVFVSQSEYFFIIRSFTCQFPVVNAEFVLFK